MFSLFVDFAKPACGSLPSLSDRAPIHDILRAVQGVRKGLTMVPTVAMDRYHAPVTGPVLAIQLYFDCLADAEAAIAQGSPLTRLVADRLPELEGADASHQIMLVRPCPVRSSGSSASHVGCAFAVHYSGEPEDMNEWLTHYMAHHVPVMAMLPQVRELEVYTRVDWISASPWRRVDHFQRNKVVFDTPPLLESALNSPVRDRLKADFDLFPPFTGQSVHVPMEYEQIVFQAASSG